MRTVAIAAAVAMLAGCGAAHDPDEEARKLQQRAEAMGDPLAHMPGIPVGNEATPNCLAAFEATHTAPDSPDLMDGTLTDCADVPEWAYALMTVGGMATEPGERPLLMSLELVCDGKSGPVCDDGHARGLL